jgi:ribosomal protein S18 acetylase RimI-like enzyme
MDPRLRPIDVSDLDAVHRLHRRIETHDGLPIATPREEFEEWREDPHLDLREDTRLAEVAGEIVAWGRIWHSPSGVREERAYVMGGVDPAHRGRGVGSALLTWQIARAEAKLRAAAPALPRYVRAWAYDFQPSALRLYERHGMRAVRYTDELLLDLAQAGEAPPVDGVEIVPWDMARSEEARVAVNDAFADHWGSTPRDPAAWAHALASFGTRLDLSFFALAEGRVVGACRNDHFPEDERVNGRREGWIMQVGVVRAHRKRGIASALIGASLDAFRRAGFTHSALGVDSENPTGAYHLYERLGFRPMRRSVVHQRDA